MVRVEDITKQEEEKKAKAKRVKNLLETFFESEKNKLNIMSYISGGLVSKGDSFNKKNPFKTILSYYFLESPTLMILRDENHYQTALKFAEEYEKIFGGEVLFQTDYSED